MFGKKEEPQKQTVTINSDNQVSDEVKEEKNLSETQEATTVQEVILNHEQRLQLIEAALFRLRGAI